MSRVVGKIDARRAYIFELQNTKKKIKISMPLSKEKVHNLNGFNNDNNNNTSLKFTENIFC